MTDARLSPDLVVVVGRIEGAGNDELVRALRATGITVRTAAGCEDAEATLRFLPARLLVVGLDGSEDVWTLIRRASGGPRAVPVVCVSGRPTLSRVAGALRRGAATFLVPPVVEEMVRERVVPLLAEASGMNASAVPSDGPGRRDPFASAPGRPAEDAMRGAEFQPLVPSSVSRQPLA